jgi:hypothetical protein
MENGLVNLLAIVSLEVFCLVAIPIILVLGTPKSKAGSQEDE